jgi:hypothetical protein
MADKKVSELTAITNLSGDDLLMVVNDPAGTAGSRKISISNFLANVAVATVHTNRTTFNANTSVNGNILQVSANAVFTGDIRIPDTTPASNNATTQGVGAGAVFFDSDYLYIAVDSTTIKRVALSTF